MSVPAARRLLWLTALLTVPVPIWLFEPARVPVAWLTQMAGYGTALWLGEVSGIAVRVLAGLSVAQALLWAALLYLAARLTARHLLPAAHRGMAAGVLALALVAAALLPIYRTTFVRDGVAVSWLGLFA